MGFRSILWQILDLPPKQWIKDIIKCCHWARTTNVGLLYPTVGSNIGDILIGVHQPKHWGICPQHSVRGRRQWWRKIRLRHSTRIYAKNIPAKFHPNAIWNDGALVLFWRGHCNKNNNHKTNNRLDSSEISASVSTPWAIKNVPLLFLR